MEVINFWIWELSPDMVRITTSDCRKEVRQITDGACILKLNILIHEMGVITREIQRKFNGKAKAVFNFVDSETQRNFK
jgi:hypothetical protein